MVCLFTPCTRKTKGAQLVTTVLPPRCRSKLAPRANTAWKALPTAPGAPPGSPAPPRLQRPLRAARGPFPSLSPPTARRAPPATTAPTPKPPSFTSVLEEPTRSGVLRLAKPALRGSTVRSPRWRWSWHALTDTMRAEVRTTALLVLPGLPAARTAAAWWLANSATTLKRGRRIVCHVRLDSTARTWAP